MPVFEDAFSVLKNDRNLTDEELVRAIRFMIAAEYEAVQLYNQLAESIDNEMAIKILNDIADEEKVHVGEFMKLLFTLDPKEAEHYQEGEKEVEEMKFASKTKAIQYLADITGKQVKIAYNQPSLSDLKKIKVLFRDAQGSMALWGIPYDMKQGQSPSDLQRADNTKEWFYLGVPGAEPKEVLEFLESVKEYVPKRPGEWDEIK